ncbi:MAG: hypothetical protein AAB786_01265 [Patescibacteria group bacterium]
MILGKKIMLSRSIENNKILILEDGKEVLKEKAEVLVFLGVDGMIRIKGNEFKEIDVAKKYLGHFNLECTDHEVGKRYALVKILRSGNYNTVNGVQVLPLLSLENAYITKCVDVKNYLKYDDIILEFFAYSLLDIQNTEELKSVIFKRYSESLPNLTKEEIEKLGVGYTLLSFGK